MRVRSSILVNRPVDAVFAYVADYRNDPEWRSEVREMRYVPEDGIGAGAHVIETSVLWGRRVVTESVITAFEVNRRVDFESISGPFRVRGMRAVEAVGDATRMTSELEWIPTSRVGQLVAPLMERSYQRTLDRYLMRLRTILEDARATDADGAADRPGA
jgi:uncharacterized membrane protein